MAFFNTVNNSSELDFGKVYTETRKEIKNYFSVIVEALEHSCKVADFEMPNHSFKLRKKIAVIDRFGSFEDVIGALLRDLEADSESLGDKKFQKIKKIVADIYYKNSNIKIESNSETFKNQIILDVLLLLSKETGRRLISKTVKLGENIIIKQSQSGAHFISRPTPRIAIELNKCSSAVAKKENGELFLAPHGRFFCTGHEVIHFWHYMSYGLDDYNKLVKGAPTLCREYDNLEEQGTISGDIGDFTVTDVQKFDPSICENNMFIEWGLRKFIRASHRSVLLPPNSKDEMLLIRAARVRAILNLVDSKDHQFFNGDTLIHRLIEEYLIDVAERLIEMGCRMDIPNKAGVLPLHIAAEKGYNHMVNLILEKSPDQLDTLDKEGNNLFHHALKQYFSADNSFFEFLVKQGEILQEPNIHGISPIHIAVSRAPLEVISLILENFPDEINRVDGEGNNLFHLVISRDELFFCQENFIKIMDLLMQKNHLLLKVPNKWGMHPLDLFIEQASKEIVLPILEKFPDEINNPINFSRLRNIAKKREMYFGVEDATSFVSFLYDIKAMSDIKAMNRDPMIEQKQDVIGEAQII